MATTVLSPQELQALLNGPAGVSPAGVVSNFVNPPTLLGGIVITMAFALSVSTIALVLRIYTKIRLIKSFDIEDYILTLSWAGMISKFHTALITNNCRAGRHMWDTQLKDFIDQLYWINVESIAYCPTVALIKVAILLQYRRIFVPHRQGSLPMYLALYITMIVIVVFYTMVMIFSIVECTPREAIWNPFVQNASCFNRNAMFQATGVFNVISDFAILIIPVPKIWKLHMTRNRKIAVTGLFATGLLACITSIVRTYYTSLLLTSSDVSYYIALIGCWTAAEMAAGILVFCLPIAPRFFSFLNPKIKSLISSLRKSTSFGDGPSGSGSGSSKPRSYETKAPDLVKKPNGNFSTDRNNSTGGLAYEVNADSHENENERRTLLADEEIGISNWSDKSFLAVVIARAPPATKRDRFETNYRGEL